MRPGLPLAAALLAASLARAELAPLPPCGPVARRHDHVEVTGQTLHGLNRIALARFGMIAFRGGAVVPIPFEIDERRGRKVVVQGPGVEKPDRRPGQLDYDDAVVFMPCDAGEQPDAATLDAAMDRLAATAWREVRVEDTLTGRAAYAYVVTAERPPHAARRYVTYDARADLVRTARYAIGMTSALPSELRLVGPTGPGPNLLDGLRLRAEGTWIAGLAHSTLTEAGARHRLLAWHDGPIRTVRVSQHDVEVALGLHLSAGTARTYFYPLHVRGPGKLRLPISPGLLFRSVNAFAGVDMRGLEGWRYRAAGREQALVIDGRTTPEEAGFDALGPWFLLRGPGVAILAVLRLSPNLARAVPVHLVYVDDAERVRPPERVRGSVPLVGYRADGLEGLPAGYYEFELGVFFLPGYEPGDERRVLDGFATPLHVSVRAPAAPAAAPAARP